MGVVINFILSQAIIIPIAVAVIRIKKIDTTYYPFLLLLFIGLLAELASFIAIKIFQTNAPVIKVYSLMECCLILYQLYLWKNNYKARRMFMLLAATCFIFWLVETIVFLNINTFSPYFRVFYAFIIVLLSINQINAMMFYHNVVLLRNPKFIICLGFIIFFLYQIIDEAALFIGSDKSVVANKIIMGFSYLNFIINLLYAVGICYIAPKGEEGYNHYFTDR